MSIPSFFDMFHKNAENSNDSWPSSSGRLSKLKIKRRRKTASIHNPPPQRRHNDEIAKQDKKKPRNEDQTHTLSSLDPHVNRSTNHDNRINVNVGSSPLVILNDDDSGGNDRRLHTNNEVEKHEGILPPTFDQQKNKAKKVPTLNLTTFQEKLKSDSQKMSTDFWDKHNSTNNKMWGKKFPDPFTILGLDTNMIERLKYDLMQQKKSNDLFFLESSNCPNEQKDKFKKQMEEPSNYLQSQYLDDEKLINHSFLGELRFPNPQSTLNNNIPQLNMTQNHSKPIMKDECTLFSSIDAPWNLKDLTFPQQISKQASKKISKTKNQYSKRLYQGDGTLTSISSLGFPFEMQRKDQNNILREESVERIGEATLENKGELQIVAHQGATIRKSCDIDEDDMPPLGHLKNGAVRKYVNSMWLSPPLHCDNDGENNQFLIKVRRYKIILQKDDLKWNKHDAPTIQFGWISDRCRLAHDPYQIAEELKK